MDQALCRLNEIEKHYGAQQVLGPVSLCVNRGEVVGMRGSNGAGKSTLMGIMAGVLRPDAGSVWHNTAIGGAVGYVPQDIALYPTLSGKDNLMFWANVHGLPRKVAKVRTEWLLGALQLEGKRRSRVETYSGGMKRRLNLAAAIMLTPRLLLLDEPTVGADAESTRIILDMVARLKQGGCGTVMISHHEDQLSAISDRIITMEAGRIVRTEQP